MKIFALLLVLGLSMWSADAQLQNLLQPVNNLLGSNPAHMMFISNCHNYPAFSAFVTGLINELSRRQNCNARITIILSLDTQTSVIAASRVSVQDGAQITAALAASFCPHTPPRDFTLLPALQLAISQVRPQENTQVFVVVTALPVDFSSSAVISAVNAMVSVGVKVKVYPIGFPAPYPSFPATIISVGSYDGILASIIATVLDLIGCVLEGLLGGVLGR